jgi:UDP-2,4-diacetamido-2,4,6-trideoxy-beta-L-altropyranose hydrolase
MKPKVFLRADGGKEMGLGHIFRMIALAGILKDDFDCFFIIKKPGSAITELLGTYHYDIQSLYENDLHEAAVNETLNHPITTRDILVLDGYHFDTAYQQAIMQTIGCKLVCVDDIFAFPFLADMVINHAGGLMKEIYTVAPGSRLLLGPAYAILRKQFYSVLPKTKLSRTGEHIFINFGGADADNFTAWVVDQVLSLPHVKKISVVLGAAFTYIDELLRLKEAHPVLNVYISITADELIEIMKDAEIAICSASTISYEFCSVTGLLFLLQTADNQTSLYNYLIAEKMALPFEELGEVISSKNFNELYNHSVANQAKTFDGFAGDRLRKEFNRLYLKNNCVLRAAVLEDLDIYFEWANDNEVRKNSFNHAGISFDEHCQWFHSNLNSTDAAFYIFTTCDNVPVANIRFKKENETATVSYLIDQRFRGCGFGKIILEKGIQQFLEENQDIKEVVGLVKNTNVPSIKAFNAIGFRETEYAENNVKSFSKTFK